MRDLLDNWRDVLPLAGLVVVAIVGAFFLFKREPEDSDQLERERRAYLNRIGRIVEGHILECVDAAPDGAEPANRSASAMRGATQTNAAKKLLFYSYSISGVTYETAQDVTGFEEQAHLKRIGVGQSASVKYDPSNPSNSILLADDWSGIH